MKIQDEVLDGKVNGISVESSLDGKTRSILAENKRDAKLFDNIEVAETIAKMSLGGTLKYYVNIKKLKIPFDYCQSIGDSKYQYYHKKTDTMYIIKENKNSISLDLGYIVFENGDVERCDKKYGIGRQKDLIRCVANIASNIIFENGDITISKITVNNPDNNYIFHVKGTTAKIHLISNSKLMDINQARKEEGKRCIPFIKQMDKFTTLYVYITRDDGEISTINSSFKSKKIMEYIMNNLENYYSDLNPHFVPVEYNGIIDIMEV